MRRRVGLAVVIFGAGGHGKVVAEIVLARGDTVSGFIDDGKPVGTEVLGLPVLGPRAWLATCGPRRVVPALGNNEARKEASLFALSLGHELAAAVHPSAVVSPTAHIGPGTVVMANASINADAQIGTGAIVNTGAVVEHDCVLGDFSHLSPNAAMGGASRLGALSHLGLCACLLPRVSVGDRSVVGAGSVVLEPLPDDVVAVGVPARIIRPPSRT